MPTMKTPSRRDIPAGKAGLLCNKDDDFALLVQFTNNDNELEVWDYIMKHSPRGRALWRKLADCALQSESWEEVRNKDRPHSVVHALWR